MFTPAQIDAATKAHGTLFFDADLNPVVPQEGQWFCEYHLEIPEEGDDYMTDGNLVEYLGPCDNYVINDAGEAAPYGKPAERHRVRPEYADDDRRPRGEILIRQS